MPSELEVMHVDTNAPVLLRNSSSKSLTMTCTLQRPTALSCVSVKRSHQHQHCDLRTVPRDMQPSQVLDLVRHQALLLVHPADVCYVASTEDSYALQVLAVCSASTCPPISTGVQWGAAGKFRTQCSAIFSTPDPKVRHSGAACQSTACLTQCITSPNGHGRPWPMAAECACPAACVLVWGPACACLSIGIFLEGIKQRGSQSRNCFATFEPIRAVCITQIMCYIQISNNLMG